MKKVLFLFLALAATLSIKAQIETKPDPTGKHSDELQTLFTKTSQIGWWVSGDLA